MRQEFDSFDSEELDLVGLYSCEDMCNFEKFYEILPSKNNFHSPLSGKRICEKGYQHVFKILNIFQMKAMKNYHNFYLKFLLIVSQSTWKF